MTTRTAFTPFALLAALVLTGCATLVDGGPSRVEATSTPPGAEVVAVGLANGERLTGTTPTTFTLDKGSDYELTFALDGYESETVVVRRTVNGWFFGNFFLGVIPMVVDAATNNIWSHTLEVASVDFTSAARRPDGTLEAEATVRTYDAHGEPVVARLPITLRPTDL